MIGVDFVVGVGGADHSGLWVVTRTLWGGQSQSQDGGEDNCNFHGNTFGSLDGLGRHTSTDALSNDPGHFYTHHLALIVVFGTQRSSSPPPICYFSVDPKIVFDRSSNSKADCCRLALWEIDMSYLVSLVEECWNREWIITGYCTKNEEDYFGGFYTPVHSYKIVSFKKLKLTWNVINRHRQ